MVAVIRYLLRTEDVANVGVEDVEGVLSFEEGEC